MKILCINIDADTESWELSKAEFDRVGLTVERFPAIVCDNRVLGFNKSVYECMKLAGNEDLLLFEDDVVFDEGYSFGSNLQLEAWFHSSGYNPLTIHLGCNIIGTDTIVWEMPTLAEHGSPLAKLHNCFQSHATFYSAECVKFIIDNFHYHKDQYKTEGIMIFDEWLRLNVLSQGRSYVMRPMIAYQRPRKSEIWNCHADYTGAHKQGNQYLMNL